ncbi:hypothetical protein D3OALGA1CA_626 [Olavius algarvensis associated proteobacterium Delta 3]|nr:hypothetical protein D3OALGA1CA_626 [Olavius algarvensis associated proteobacterium Delta 3]CAB5114385.1 hypothetical protein D3OALGB2SA_2588 [Olavius algarvensis associated proteobacterium Delta 3]
MKISLDYVLQIEIGDKLIFARTLHQMKTSNGKALRDEAVVHLP